MESRGLGFRVWGFRGVGFRFLGVSVWGFRGYVRVYRYTGVSQNWGGGAEYRGDRKG